MTSRLWTQLLPKTDDVEIRARAGAVLVACGGIVAACVALLLTWRISGDLEGRTVVAAGVFAAILGGIAALVRRGRVTLGGWLLTGLLTALITADVWGYGLGSPAAAGYTIPIVLAACALGPWAGAGIAVASSVSVWLLAWGEVAGWYAPLSSVEVSHLSFNAPALTVIFLLLAAIPAVWLQLHDSRAHTP